ncbi:MAG: class I SAM-dependent methyltransferase [Oscillatoriales cyanobacterium RM2_1_1]|nr:class I SAM-dependent methyltransferase [Oscillatoriales cyanobacterium SM2_3_0]NJO47229.1 class I SAM-dependent methyltransferase [Oscillatoriales cyanobacterium RM2_1_1]
MTDLLTKLTYQAFQQGKSYFGLAHKTLSTELLKLVNPPAPERVPQPLDIQVLNQVRIWLDEIIETDWQDAEQGVYPASLLFENPWEDFFRHYPALWLDMVDIQNRANRKQYQSFSPGVDTDGYPSYYLQNFHHQTDGYLSEKSAELYDLQVDILFNGGADAMRRRVLAPLKQGLTEFQSVPPKQIRVLDVATGTGRTLRYIRAALPQASLHGIDLSPAYLRKANQLLSEIPGELPQLVQASGEAIPYLDNYFHGVTSVFLFHELPPQVRQQVIAECFRVTKPGGLFIICDSIQAIDFPEMQPMLENFPVTFHEPYYRSYITDDLVQRLEQAGFETVRTENHFVSKYWIAQKPIES